MKSLLIGDNPFIGVSHLAQSRARDTLSKLNIPAMTNVVSEAMRYGASGFSFSTHPTNRLILQSLKQMDVPLDLYPVLPYAEGYVRLANEVGMTGLIKHFMSDLSLASKTRILLKGGISAASLNPLKMLNLYVDVEIDRYLNVKPDRSSLKSILLHEVITDLALAFRSKELFIEYDRHVRKKFHTSPGYVTRNFARFVQFFDESQLSLDNVTVMTPFNKAGFQMNPSREECEAALTSIHKNVKVIGMSVLAGGYLTVEEATGYLNGLPNLFGATIGVSSISHAQSTFQKFSKLLDNQTS